MFKRPAYISILVGFLSIFCVVMVFAMLRIVFLSGSSEGGPTPPTPPAATPSLVATDDDPIIAKTPAQLIALGFAIIAFICTVNMLEGANWARWLYTIAWLFYLICTILAHSAHILPYVPVLAVYGFVVPFLFLPGANEFFRKAD